MSTPSTNPDTSPPVSPAPQRIRWQAANRLAGRLHAAAPGIPESIYWNLPYSGRSFDDSDYTKRILSEAPRIASSGDPAAVRVGRTPRGTITVILLHGTDWSLILTPGRPLPGHMAAVTHAPASRPQFMIWLLDPSGWQREVATMNLAILAALDTPARPRPHQQAVKFLHLNDRAAHHQAAMPHPA